MKTLRFLLILCSFFCVSQTWAYYDFITDGSYYWIKQDAPDEVVLVVGGNYSGSVTVPSQVTNNGTTYNVTQIAGSVFDGFSNLTSLTIPEGISTIDINAIKNCSKLTTVNLPSTLTNIEVGNFRDCNNLMQINFPAGNTNYVSDGNILYTADRKTLLRVSAAVYRENFIVPEGVEVIGDWAFSGCQMIYSVALPSTLTIIKECAFIGSAITSITIPEGVHTIEVNAFSDCTRLLTASIPASATTIGNNIFGDCEKLTVITVADGNTAYKSVDGVLFTADEKTLVQYPRGKANTVYIIPFGVTHIADYAFCGGCKNLTAIEIPSSVTDIGTMAFYKIPQLTSIFIPASVTNLGIYVFISCTNVTTVKVAWNNPNQVAVYMTFGSLTSNTNIVLYVPQGTKSLYQNAPEWKFFQNIEEYDITTTTLSGTTIADINIHIEGNRIAVENAKDYPVMVYDMQGRLVTSGKGVGSYTVPKAGVYIIEIGQIVKKVIVSR